MLCLNCGGELDRADRFCRVCGARARLSLNKQSNSWLYAILAAAVLIVATGGYWFHRSSSFSPRSIELSGVPLADADLSFADVDELLPLLPPASRERRSGELAEEQVELEPRASSTPTELPLRAESRSPNPAEVGSSRQPLDSNPEQESEGVWSKAAASVTGVALSVSAQSRSEEASADSESPTGGKPSPETSAAAEESSRQATSKAPSDREDSPGTDQKPPRRAKPGSRVLLPGGQAWNQKPSSSTPATASQTAEGQASSRRPAPASQASRAPREGVIYWTGRLVKNQVIVIDEQGARQGFADGKLLPGVPVEVRILSQAVTLVEKPGPQNSWKRVAFRCARTTKGTVTLNIQWRLSR